MAAANAVKEASSIAELATADRFNASLQHDFAEHVATQCMPVNVSYANMTVRIEDTAHDLLCNALM